MHAQQRSSRKPVQRTSAGGKPNDKAQKQASIATEATKNRPESKREEFRKYLEKAGVMDTLTRLLVSLYEEPEKPPNAIEYLMERLSNDGPIKMEKQSLNAEMVELQKKVADLERDNDSLRKKLVEMESVINYEGATSSGQDEP